DGRTSRRRPSVEQLVLLDRCRRLGGAQQLPHSLLPLLDVEVLFVLQDPAQHGRKLVERREQLGDRFPQRLHLKAALARPHVFEDALLGARRDDRLDATLHEHAGAPLRPALLLDGHQPDDGIRAPILAVPEKHHAVALDIHRASGAPPVGGPWSGTERLAEPLEHPADHAHDRRRYSFFIFFLSSRSCRSAAASRAARSSRSASAREPPAACRSRHARSAERSASVSGRSCSARASCACMSPTSRSYRASSSRSAASFFSSTPTRSRCFAANRPATATVSVSWISDASRPRRSASASRWRSCARSRSVRATVSRVSITATFASMTASRICRVRSRRSPGGVAASRAARRASRRRSNTGASFSGPSWRRTARAPAPPRATGTAGRRAACGRALRSPLAG